MTYVELDRRNFQATIDGKPVDLYTIANGRGLTAKITNQGAKIQQLLVRNRLGRIDDVALGYESIAGVMSGQASMGAFIGRYANRIARGKFSLDGREYQLTVNNGPNSLHGGLKGSRFVVFDPEPVDARTLRMRYVFRDGEEGYPGNVTTVVTYSVTDENELVLSWEATTDRPTIVNFTGHAYFNLAGAGNGDILGHVATINADRYLPVDDTQIPTGEIRTVKGTPFDFAAPHKIGARIHDSDDQLRIGGGYDHTYVLNKQGHEASLACRICEPNSGRVLEVITTEAGLQFFSGNNLDGKPPRDVGKGGKAYGQYSAFCVEPQRFPDSPNHPEFPSTVLKPGERCTGKIVYRFSVVP
jgi:aldose 1-epimerase